MAPPTNKLAADFDELYAHARDVLQLQQPLDRVVAATKAVSPDGFDIAYGITCQGWGLALIPVREHAEDVVEKISRSVVKTSDEIIKVVDDYDGTDQKHAQQLRAIGADLPTTNNWVLTPGAKFDWKNYNPTDGGAWTQTDTEEGRAKGAGGGGNLKELELEITEKSKQNYGSMLGHIAAIGADTGSFLGDPIATMASWATTWLLEHLKPLKLMLDGLAGNPEMIKAAADTWKKIGGELNRLSEHYAAAVKRGTGGWNGSAGESYREKTAKNTIDTMDCLGTLATAMSIIVASTGEIVDAVRAAARDLIGELVGTLASSLAKRIFLYEPPAEELKQIADVTRKVARLVKALIVTLDDFAAAIPMIIESYKAVAKIVPHLDGI
jgi:uncharacterized protein YukE